MSAHSPLQAGRLMALLCIAYSLSQFYRSTNAVIGPDLSRDLQIGPAELSLITSAFFIAFALVQPLVGMALDRLGPRLTMISTLSVAILGAALFASLDTVPGLMGARALIGIGNSALLMGPLVILSRWFPPQKFSFYASLLIALGSLGGLAATAPLAAATAAVGWRGAFWGMSAITVIIALVVGWSLRDTPPDHPLNRTRPESLREVLHGLAAVFRNRQMYLIFGIHFTAYACVVTIQGLWGGPYLADIHGLDGIARGQILLAMAIGIIAGYLILGPLDRVFDSRKRLVLAGCAGIIAILAVLGLWQRPPLWSVAGLFTIMGFCSGAYAHIVAHGRAIFPDHLVGRGLTILNCGTMLGAFTFQSVTGWILAALTPKGAAHPPLAAYQTMFLTLAVALTLATLLYMRMADAKPSADHLRHRS